jgi:DNA helicase HerA-like ATPase
LNFCSREIARSGETRQDNFKSVPEIGDPEKPKVVFFFDEAHLLFTGGAKR